MPETSSLSYRIMRASEIPLHDTLLHQLVVMEREVHFDSYLTDTPEIQVTAEDLNKWDWTPEVRIEKYRERYLRYAAQQGAEMVVATRKGQVKGFAAMSNLPPEAETDEPQFNGRPWLRKLYIEAGERKRGLGGALLRIAEDWFLDQHPQATRQHGVTLEVVSYAKPAVEFYQHRGYQETDEQLADHYDILPTVLMRKFVRRVLL